MRLESLRMEIEKIDAESEEERESVTFERVPARDDHGGVGGSGSARVMAAEASVSSESEGEDEESDGETAAGERVFARVATNTSVDHVLVNHHDIPDPRTQRVEQLYQDEEAFLLRMEVGRAELGPLLLQLEEASPERFPGAPIAKLLHLLPAVIGLESEMLVDLEKVVAVVKTVGLKIPALLKAYEGRLPAMILFARYRNCFHRFKDALQTIGQQLGREAFQERQTYWVARATARLHSNPYAADHAAADLEGWFGEPLLKLSRLSTALDTVSHLSEVEQDRRLIAPTLEHVDHMMSVTINSGRERDCQDEYVEMYASRLKALCPELYAPWREYFGAWELRLVKSKASKHVTEDEIAQSKMGKRPSWRFQRNKGTQDDQSFVNDVSDKAGAEVRLYVFNDSLFVTGKKGGKVCVKDFAHYASVEILETDACLDVFGLKITEGDTTTCSVYRAGSAAAKDELLDVLKREHLMSHVSMRCRHNPALALPVPSSLTEIEL
jgi:hypothetical protein